MKYRACDVSPGMTFPVLLATLMLILVLGETSYRSYYGPYTDLAVYRDPSTGMIDKTTGLSKPFLSYTGIRDSQGQKQAYQQMMLAIGLSCIAIALLKRLANHDMRWLNWIALPLICLVVLASLPECAALLFAYHVRAQIAGLVLTCLAIKYRGLQAALRGRYSGLIVASAYLFYWIGRGLFLPIDLTVWNWNQLEEMGSHWAVIFGPADAISTHSMTDLSLGYGNWSVLLAATLGSWMGPLSLGSYFRITASMQIVFFVILFVAWMRYASWKLIPCAIALLMSAWCFHFGGTCSTFYLTPNHSAWRYLFFAVAVLTQVLTIHLDGRRAALFLGFVSGMALTHNFETGVAISAGNITCVGLRAFKDFPKRRFRSLLITGIEMGLGGAVAIACYYLAHRIVTGSFPPGLALLMSILSMTKLIGVAGGNVRQFDPLALVIFGHAALVLLATAARLDRVNARDSVRAAAAATILVWFAYFANRPHVEYLMVYCSLYGVLLIDAWRLLTSPWWQRRANGVISGPFALAFVSMGFVVLPSLCQRHLDLYDRTAFSLGFATSQKTTGQTIDGVILTEGPRTTRLIQRARYLQDHADRQTSLYLTMDSFLIPRLSGYWPKTDNYDPFTGTAFAEKYERLVAKVSDPSIETVYLDQDSLSVHLITPNGNQGLTWEQASRWFFHYLRQEVAKNHKLATTKEGWEIWIRKTTVADSPDDRKPE